MENKTINKAVNYQNTKMTCSCGQVFEVGSTGKDIKIEICSACHPFYTGTQKYIDTAGRLEKFKERVSKGQQMQGKKQGKDKKNENTNS